MVEIQWNDSSLFLRKLEMQKFCCSQ